mmetsp:Transcript_15782/g.53164  ORF Transcript_15782/g.53164 Transcript_15782/m.53164 type:complete len:231 (-) Transcript_15782:1652-2344(-)
MIVASSCASSASGPEGHMILKRSTSISVGVPTSFKSISSLETCSSTNLTYVAGAAGFEESMAEVDSDESSSAFKAGSAARQGFSEWTSSRSWCVPISLILFKRVSRAWNFGRKLAANLSQRFLKYVDERRSLAAGTQMRSAVIIVRTYGDSSSTTSTLPQFVAAMDFRAGSSEASKSITSFLTAAEMTPWKPSCSASKSTLPTYAPSILPFTISANCSTVSAQYSAVLRA